MKTCPRSKDEELQLIITILNLNMSWWPQIHIEGQILGMTWYGTSKKRGCFGSNPIDMCHPKPIQKIRFVSNGCQIEFHAHRFVFNKSSMRDMPNGPYHVEKSPSSTSVVIDNLKTKSYVCPFSMLNLVNWHLNLRWHFSGIAFQSANASWRNLRKIFTMEIMSPRSIQNAQRIRAQEVDSLSKSILRHVKSYPNTPLELNPRLWMLTTNFISQIILSKRFYPLNEDQETEHTKEFKFVFSELRSCLEAFWQEIVVPSSSGLTLVASKNVPWLWNLSSTIFWQRF